MKLRTNSFYSNNGIKCHDYLLARRLHLVHHRFLGSGEFGMYDIVKCHRSWTILLHTWKSEQHSVLMNVRFLLLKNLWHTFVDMQIVCLEKLTPSDILNCLRKFRAFVLNTCLQKHINLSATSWKFIWQTFELHFYLASADIL